MAVARRLMVRTTPTRFEVNSWRAPSECDLTGMGTVDEPGLGLADQRSEHVAGANVEVSRTAAMEALPLRAPVLNYVQVGRFVCD